MLKNFTIKNYKSIKDLEIKELKRINLLIGRNNAGKSNILEAILLFATRFSSASIVKILSLHKDIYLERGMNGRIRVSSSVENFLSLITDRSQREMRQCGIELKGNDETVTFRSYKVEKNEKDGETYVKFFPFSESELNINSEEVQEMQRVAIGKELDEAPNFRTLSIKRWVDDGVVDTRCIYVNCTSRESESVEPLWNNIVLTPLKHEIIKALQLISPDISDVAIMREGIREEIHPYVNFKEQAIPLHSMGDGIAHIFNIMLALVNAKDGVLLLDEMENGLHVRTLEKLWTMVNELSKQLNVQVFVTTHSNDCIRAFRENAREDGCFLSLNCQDDEVSCRRIGLKKIDKLMASNIDIRDYTNDDIIEDEE